MNTIIACSILFFISSFAVFFFYSGIRLNKQFKQAAKTELNIHENGVTTEGSIVRHHHPSVFIMHSLIYQYQHENIMYQSKQLVKRSDFRKLPDGTAITILYLPSDPDTSMLLNIKNLKIEQLHYVARTDIQTAICFMIVAISIFIDLIRQFLHF